MSLILLKSDTYQRKPWKNGQGETREIFIQPGGEGADFIWRLSMASLMSDSDFSIFTGMSRSIVLLGSAQITLFHQEAHSKSLPAFEVYNFSGDWHTKASVQRIGFDFNVIWNPKKVKLTTKVVPLLAGKTKELNFKGLLFCAQGMIRFDQFILNEYDSLKIEGELIKITSDEGAILIMVVQE